MADSSDAIAKVVADLRAGRVALNTNDGLVPPSDPAALTSNAHVAWRAIRDPVVVDTTEIFWSLAKTNKEPTAVFGEDPCVAPPFEEALICMVTRKGVTYAVHVDASRHDDGWTLRNHMWVGGRHHTDPVATGGPVLGETFIADESGSVGATEWVYFSPEYVHPGPMTMVLVAYNFLNCRNVELVEPRRSRSQVRRLARTGVTVKTINVFPTGRRSSSPTQGNGAGMPLRTVRGHFNHYGACCPSHKPRGLLFGKHQGRFFIPQHAQGSAEFGEVHADYRLLEDDD